MERLTSNELVALVRRVFRVTKEDRALAILIDLPDGHCPDHDRWRVRREMAFGWATELAGVSQEELGIPVHLYVYRNVRHNNADLPSGAWAHRFGELPATADELDEERQESFHRIFRTHSILIAPTQFSATAPLKLAARKYGFRAATMPGFSPAMIPALRLDYGEINRRVWYLKGLLDFADAAHIHFRVDGREDHRLVLDLRHRAAHASGGLFPDGGVAGNLPSGETYIVPYEGEVRGDASRSEGTLPVQFGDDVVVYAIADNRATGVLGEGPAAEEERKALADEPAYGNLAELGLGVLSDFGLEPTGEILLDEKLALHIAFGRSDHFGGQVGAGDFSRPEAVVHIDRVYLPATQPRIQVVSADLVNPDGTRTALLRDDAYVVAWPA
jgi:leucyl aminopeptidase (aminopeptidase T)